MNGICIHVYSSIDMQYWQGYMRPPNIIIDIVLHVWGGTCHEWNVSSCRSIRMGYFQGYMRHIVIIIMIICLSSPPASNIFSLAKYIL